MLSESVNIISFYHFDKIPVKKQQSSIDLQSYVACPDCDLLMPKLRPVKGHKTVCPRCGSILMHHCQDTVSRSLALSLSGLLLFLPAVFMPLMTFSTLGMSESDNIVETILEFIHREYYIVAVAVFFSAILFPLLKLSLLTGISFSLKTNRYYKALGKSFRLYNHLEEWAMTEVYLLGIMITVIKMHQTTDISYNTGFFCFIGLVICTMASSLSVCKESFWNLIETKGKTAIHPYLDPKSPVLDSGRRTASDFNIILCRDCGKLQYGHATTSIKQQKCTRCGAALHYRKPGSVSKTWALMLTAAILFFPANLLPIMRVEFLGIPSDSNILDGIKLFFQDGSYFIALIILTASILIPIFKVVGLLIVLLTIRLKRPLFLRQKTIMFRFIEFIGRWSMLDIFVIALLGSFVNFSFLTSIQTAPAATYFCLVVLTTMMAALTFDPRLMWDLVPKYTDSNDTADPLGG